MLLYKYAFEFIMNMQFKYFIRKFLRMIGENQDAEFLTLFSFQVLNQINLFSIKPVLEFYVSIYLLI